MTTLKILHFHAFKNGGSTLDWILKRNFGNQFAEYHGPSAQDSLLQADIFKYIDNFPEVLALSSHHFRFPIQNKFGGADLIPISFLRHPIDRIYSVYAHEQRNISLEVESRMSFKTWLELSFNESPYSIRDVQTNLYADGGTYYEVPDIGTLKRACHFLDSLAFCGIVEEYDSSIVWFEEIISRYGVRFDGAYRQQNINPERVSSLQQRIENILNLIGDALFDQLIQNNLYDLSLYEHASKKLQAQISQIANFDMKVRSLRQRSLMLGN